MQKTKVPNNHTGHIQNGAQSKNENTNLKKHNKNSAQATTVENHHTEHI